jgi:hypothetical protein
MVATALTDLSPDDPWKTPGEQAVGAVQTIAHVGAEAAHRRLGIRALFKCKNSSPRGQCQTHKTMSL